MLGIVLVSQLFLFDELKLSTIQGIDQLLQVAYQKSLDI